MLTRVALEQGLGLFERLFAAFFEMSRLIGEFLFLFLERGDFRLPQAALLSKFRGFLFQAALFDLLFSLDFSQVRLAARQRFVRLFSLCGIALKLCSARFDLCRCFFKQLPPAWVTERPLTGIRNTAPTRN